MTMEERVAKLEAQVASLLARDATEDPAPTGYATSKYSVEEMDDLLDKVAEMTEEA